MKMKGTLELSGIFCYKNYPEASGNQSGDVPAEMQAARSSSLGIFV